MYTFLFRHSFQIDPGQVQTRFCEATWWWGPQGGWGNTTSSPHHHRGWRHQCIKHRFHQVSHIPRLCFGFKILDKDFRFQDDRRMSLWFPFLNWQDRMEALQMAKDIKCAACEADVSFPDVFCVWTGDWKSMDFLKRTNLVCFWFQMLHIHLTSLFAWMVQLSGAINHCNHQQPPQVLLENLLQRAESFTEAFWGPVERCSYLWAPNSPAEDVLLINSRYYEVQWA